MSGGHFNHEEHSIREIAEDIECTVNNNNSTEKDRYGDTIGRHYPEEIIIKYKETASLLFKAVKMVHRIDYLESGDDGEDSFLERWKEEIE